MDTSELAHKADIAVTNLCAGEYYSSISELVGLDDFPIFFIWYHRLSPAKMQLFNRCFLRGTTHLSVYLKQNSHKFNIEYVRNKTYVSCTASRVQEVLHWFGNLPDVKNIPAKCIEVGGFKINSYGFDQGRAKLLFDLIAFCISKEAIDSLLFDLRGTFPLISRFLLMPDLDFVLTSGLPGTWLQKLNDLIIVLGEYLPDRNAALIAACLVFEKNITDDFLKEHDDPANDTIHVVKTVSAVMDLYHNPDLYDAQKLVISEDGETYTEPEIKLFSDPIELVLPINQGNSINAGQHKFIHDSYSSDYNNLTSAFTTELNVCNNMKSNVFTKVNKACARTMRDVSIQQTEFLLKDLEVHGKPAHVYCVAKPTSKVQYLIPQFPTASFHITSKTRKFFDYVDPDQGTILEYETSQGFRDSMLRNYNNSILMIDSADGVLKTGENPLKLNSHKYAYKALAAMLPFSKGAKGIEGFPVMIWCRFAFNIDNYDKMFQDYFSLLVNMYYFYYYPPDNLLDLSFTLVLIRRSSSMIDPKFWNEKIYYKNPWNVVKSLEYYRRAIQYKIFSCILTNRLPLIGVDAIKSYVRAGEYEGNVHIRVDYRDIKNVHNLNDITGLYDEIDIGKYYDEQRNYLGLAASQKRVRKKTGDTALPGESMLATRSLKARAAFTAHFDSMMA